MTLEMDRPLVTSPDVVFREEDDGAFLFHPETGELKCLNPLGSMIWMLCDGRRTPRLLEEELNRRYPHVPRDTVRRDLVAFLEDLAAVAYVEQP